MKLHQNLEIKSLSSDKIVVVDRLGLNYRDFAYFAGITPNDNNMTAINDKFVEFLKSKGLAVGGIKSVKIPSKFKPVTQMYSKKRRIICETDGKVFDSIVEAAEYYHIPASSIGSTCSGRQMQTHGLDFRYVNSDGRYGARN